MDGMVAVLVSPGYGAGWSTWGDSDPRPVHAVTTCITGNGPTSEANTKLYAAAPALAEALARFVVDGEGCAACGMDGRPGCGCKQEQGRAALEACGWQWGGR